MPEFVTCPACGCRVQMMEGTIGQQVRCIACRERFVADPAVKPPPPPPRRPAQPARHEEQEVGRDGRPFCPGCGRRVNWEWVKCFHCGEPFDLSDDSRRRDPESWLRSRPRRDTVPHRGTLIASLGNITLGFGAVSLCIFGLGLLVTLPLGITTIVLATSDLGQMRSGQMDSSGQTETEHGRTAAITGMALSVVFAAGWLLLQFARL